MTNKCKRSGLTEVYLASKWIRRGTVVIVFVAMLFIGRFFWVHTDKGSKIEITKTGIAVIPPDYIKCEIKCEESDK